MIFSDRIRDRIHLEEFKSIHKHIIYIYTPMSNIYWDDQSRRCSHKGVRYLQEFLKHIPATSYQTYMTSVLGSEDNIHLVPCKSHLPLGDVGSPACITKRKVLSHGISGHTKKVQKINFKYLKPHWTWWNLLLHQQLLCDVRCSYDLLLLWHAVYGWVHASQTHRHLLQVWSCQLNHGPLRTWIETIAKT